MNSLAVGPLIAATMFVCGVLGMYVNKWTPDSHLTENARDLIKSVVGLTTTLSAMVLSLLIASSYSLFNSQQAGLETLSARAIEIDRMLEHYGPEAAQGREILKAAIVQSYEHIEGVRKDDPKKLTLNNEAADEPMQTLNAYLDTLQPDTEAKKRLVLKMGDLYGSVVETRDLMYMRLSSPLSWQLLLILTLWTSALFFGFGLLSQTGVTHLAALAAGAAVLGGAIFLIVELSEPYTGVIRISPAALRQAISAVGG